MKQSDYKTIIVLDTSATINPQHLQSQLAKSGYNLCELIYNLQQVYSINQSIDHLVVIDPVGSTEYLQDLALVNDNILNYTLISNIECLASNFNYIPLKMLQLACMQTNKSSSEGLVQIILDALSILSDSHSYYVNLSFSKYKKQCQKLLSALGFSLNHKGTKQLIYASYLCMFNITANLYASVYPFVAEYYDYSVDAVERNIRSCISVAAQNYSSGEVLQNLFCRQYHISNQSLQPLATCVLAGRNKQVIYNIANTLWQYIY